MRTIIFVLSITAFTFACDDGGDTKGGEADMGGTAPILNVVTYNAGLARGFVDYADQRVAEVGPALVGIDVDILCLQEVWTSADRQAIEASVAANLPNKFSIPADPGMCMGMGCMQEETDNLVACVRPACDAVPPEMLIGCATTNCAAEVDALSADCLTCVGSNVGKSLDEMLDACGPEASMRTCFAYEGSFGTNILSRYPLAETDALVFPSSLNRRAVIYAKATGTAFGDVHVFCTHLTANLSAVPYPGDAGSWAAEQANQIEAMRAFVDEKAGDGGKVVLLGDFNCGPGVAGKAEAELIENYSALSAGFDPTFATQPDATCTFCGDNPLVSGVDRDHSVLLDHVLIRGFGDAEATGSRVVDQSIQLEVDGMTVESAVSDHYGLRVQIQ